MASNFIDLRTKVIYPFLFLKNSQSDQDILTYQQDNKKLFCYPD